MRALADWLEYQQLIHPREIALGLERVRAVWHALGAPQPAPLSIVVGGTNGKGSTVALLEAMLAGAGLRVGAYTSPHLLRYNERVRVAGDDADDGLLIAAFERIEAARGDTQLTYFEFGTLAALLVFADAALDVAVLEVGLGGRLDAVNLIDADVAIVTTVDVDHEEFLGRERDQIAREKAGIFRAGRPAIVGDPAAPDALAQSAREIGALLQLAGRDFHARLDRTSWAWSHADGTRYRLPLPELATPQQRDNAAAAIAAIHALRARVPVSADAIAAAVATARAPARLQLLATRPDIVLDVAHNPQAARTLAAWLAAHPVAGRELAVFSALRDKDLDGIVAPLARSIAHWYIAGLAHESARGLHAQELAQRLVQLPASAHADVAAALATARADAAPDDRIVVFGSFLTAAAALRALNRD